MSVTLQMIELKPLAFRSLRYVVASVRDRRFEIDHAASQCRKIGEPFASSK